MFTEAIHIVLVHTLVPKTASMNYRSVISQMNFSVSHIFRKGDSLANHRAAHVGNVRCRTPLFSFSYGRDIASMPSQLWWRLMLGFLWFFFVFFLRTLLVLVMVLAGACSPCVVVVFVSFF